MPPIKARNPKDGSAACAIIVQRGECAPRREEHGPEREGDQPEQQRGARASACQGKHDPHEALRDGDEDDECDPSSLSRGHTFYNKYP